MLERRQHIEPGDGKSEPLPQTRIDVLLDGVGRGQQVEPSAKRFAIVAHDIL
jgi:hypothetical protein